MIGWYLATPYTSYKGYGKEDVLYYAYTEACKQAGLLVKAGFPVFSPIAHSHPIAHYGNVDAYSHDVWLEQDDVFINAAIGMIECHLPGWENSKGMDYERGRFQAQKKPIILMQPGKVPEFELLRAQNKVWKDRLRYYESPGKL